MKIQYKMKPRKKQKRKRKGPLSMYPLKPEEALSAFMKIDPKKLKKAEKEEKDVLF